MISIIIPNWNSGPLLERCLLSLQEQTCSEACEIIVVDDGSTDESARSASRFPDVILLRQDHLGPAAARNRGLEAARGNLILFLDSDCSARSDWITEISGPLLAQNCLVTVGRFVSEQTGLVPRLVQQELEGRFARMKCYQDVDFLNSATCGFARRVIQENRFDAAFEKLEDVDLSFRLAAAGIPIRYVPTAVVDHHHPETLWAYLRRKFRYGRAAPALYRKFPGKSLRDTSTPPHRRLQLAFIALATVVFPFSMGLSALLILAALTATIPAAGGVALVPAVLYPPFSLAGSVFFLLGWGIGTISLFLRSCLPGHGESSGTNQ